MTAAGFGRQRREWSAGTKLTVEEADGGVLLKPAPTFAETRPEDVFGALPYKRKPKTRHRPPARILVLTPESRCHLQRIGGF